MDAARPARALVRGRGARRRGRLPQPRGSRGVHPAALADGLTAELLDIRDAGDRLVAVIHTHAPPEWERSPEPHGELVTIRDGKVTEMVIYPTVEDALIAAGLDAGG